MVVVADEPEIKTAGKDFEALGAKVGVLKADLAEVDESAIANVTPASSLAEQHRKKDQPGSAAKL
jgi:hypothetical protein